MFWWGRATLARGVPGPGCASVQGPACHSSNETGMVTKAPSGNGRRGKLCSKLDKPVGVKASIMYNKPKTYWCCEPRRECVRLARRLGLVTPDRPALVFVSLNLLRAPSLRQPADTQTQRRRRRACSMLPHRKRCWIEREYCENQAPGLASQYSRSVLRFACVCSGTRPAHLIRRDQTDMDVEKLASLASSFVQGRQPLRASLHCSPAKPCCPDNPVRGP